MISTSLLNHWELRPMVFRWFCRQSTVTNGGFPRPMKLVHDFLLYLVASLRLLRITRWKAAADQCVKGGRPMSIWELPAALCSLASGCEDQSTSGITLSTRPHHIWSNRSPQNQLEIDVASEKRQGGVGGALIAIELKSWYFTPHPHRIEAISFSRFLATFLAFRQKYPGSW